MNECNQDPEDVQMEGEDERQAQREYVENQYVKVFGIIKSLAGQKILQAFKIMQIKELNEITHHMLECMNASIFYSSKSSGDSLDVPVHSTNPLKNANLNGTSTTSNNNSGGLSTIHSQVMRLELFASDSDLNVLY